MACIVLAPVWVEVSGGGMDRSFVGSKGWHQKLAQTSGPMRRCRQDRDQTVNPSSVNKLAQ
jgi:hypothetical protein